MQYIQLILLDFENCDTMKEEEVAVLLIQNATKTRLTRNQFTRSSRPINQLVLLALYLRQESHIRRNSVVILLKTQLEVAYQIRHM